MSTKLLLIGLVLRIGVAIWNGFFGPSYGADLDALTFHEQAAIYARDLETSQLRIGWVYSVALGSVYYLFTDSVFLGSLLSCFAWLWSGAALSKAMRVLSIPASRRVLAIFIYCFLPSSIVYTSVTLREAYQLLFVNLALVSALNIYLNKESSKWIVIAVSTVGMGLLHGALFAFGVIFALGLMLLIAIRGRAVVVIRKLVVVVPIFFALSIYAFVIFGGFAYSLENGLAAAVESYQQGALGIDARANYRSEISLDDFFGLLMFIPTALFQYLFEPTPWRGLSLVDAPVILENIMRLLLLLAGFSAVRKVDRERRLLTIFLLGSFLLLELIWSLGTTNWGTAIRHHIPSTGLLLVAAFIYKGSKSRIEHSVPSERLRTPEKWVSQSL